MKPNAADFPFQPGQAVARVQYQTWTRPIHFRAATVVRVAEKFVTVQFQDNRRFSTLSPEYLVYRGYCPKCEVPAVSNAQGKLVCPECHQAATAAPPPPALVWRWFPPQYTDASLVAYESAVRNHNCSLETAFAAAQERTMSAYREMVARTLDGLEPLEIVLDVTRGKLLRHAVLDERERFLAELSQVYGWLRDEVESLAWQLENLDAIRADEAFDERAGDRPASMPMLIRCDPSLVA